MPALGLIGLSGVRWLPPFPLPLFLLWPLALLCLGLAWLLRRPRPIHAEQLGATVAAFCELRGLRIDVTPAQGRPVRIWFV